VRAAALTRIAGSATCAEVVSVGLDESTPERYM
jgi:hypothetical protein